MEEKKMYDNTVELAENKLLLLYIIKSIKYTISNAQLTDIVLEHSFINYFTLQQYIAELEKSNFIKLEEKNNKEFVLLTRKGDSVLSLFKDRLSQGKMKSIDEYLYEQIDSIKRELNIFADYTPDNNDSFSVNLKAIEGNDVLLDLNVSVPTKNQAKELCSKWKNNSSEIYNKIMEALIE
jgi:predicted transcriptional regulator